jgi:hypothetical protein
MRDPLDSLLFHMFMLILAASPVIVPVWALLIYLGIL